MSDERKQALKAFEALCADIEQFDDHPFIEEGSELFSNRVPEWMKSYLVNWLRNFVRDHAATVRAALADEPLSNANESP